jgi:hypothetical protein
MKFVKILVSVIIVVAASYGGWYMFEHADQLQFKSVCEDRHKRYTKLCNNVGKYAWTQESVLKINEKNYGKIIGVAWRKKGGVISSRSQKNKRRSESNSYYYIVGNPKDINTQFLMLASQIDPREEKTK